MHDARSIWTWRNEPATRAASFSQDPVPWDMHERWFASRVNSPATHIWVASDDAGHDLGYVRFDIDGDTAEISVALDAPARQQRWGRAVIRAACDAELASGPIRRVVAHIKQDNDASLRAFRAAGFVVDAELPRAEGAAWALHFDPAAARA